MSEVMWKCTKCQEMVSESRMKSHRCSTVFGFVPSQLRGSKIGKQVGGAVELAYLRGKQKTGDETRAAQNRISRRK